MLPDFLVFTAIQRPWLSQDRVGHPDLAHVVQQGPDLYDEQLLAGKAQAAGYGLGDGGDPLGVAARVGVAGLQGVHHRGDGVQVGLGQLPVLALQLGHHPGPRAAQSAGEHAHHGVGQQGRLVQEHLEVVARDLQQAGRLRGPGRGRARSLVQQGHLPEESPRPFLRQEHLLPGLQALGDPHPPGTDDEEGVRRTVLLDHHLAGAEAPPAGYPGHQGQVLVGHSREEVQLAQRGDGCVAAGHGSAYIVGTRPTVSTPGPRGRSRPAASVNKFATRQAKTYT
jgi:hypothetical protein